VIIEHGPVAGARADYDVHLVRTPGVYTYLDVQMLTDFMLGVRRTRRSRPGFHFTVAVGRIRVYGGVSR
jgi:hypothetical protein